MTVLGILGGGQLGRMLALAGYPLGLRFRVFDPSPVAPAGQVAQLIAADLDDEQALGRFALGTSAVTYEFENVPVAAAEWLAERVPVFPPPRALATAQDRLFEKQLFQRLGIPTPPFAPVATAEELATAVAAIGLPAVLKTRRFGYDGKGQRVLRQADDLAPAWQALGEVPLILEGFVPFERELSVLTVRGQDGTMAAYPLVENHHREGTLRLSLAPAPGALRWQAVAEAYAQQVLMALDYVGVLAIEFFEWDGQLLANEMAPRVHNSGHWTIEGAEVSQFENHLRAVMGWPLGATTAPSCSAMLNWIGDTPETAAVLRVRGAHHHLYGKSAAPGRKLGHTTITAGDRDELRRRLGACPGGAEWLPQVGGQARP